MCLFNCNYPIYKFCEKNKIDCDFDFNRDENVRWVEIYFDDELLFQVDGTMPVKEFIKCMNILNKNYNSSLEEIDFWIAFLDENKLLFKRFYKKYKEVFKK